MASFIPWFKIMALEIISDRLFRGLSHSDLGIWLRCMAYHAVDGGVPTDPEALGKLLGVRASSAKKYLPMLQKLLVPIEGLPPNLAKIATELTGVSASSDSFLFSVDLLEQIGTYREKVLINQANGRLGGRPKQGALPAQPKSDRFSDGNRSGGEEEQEGDVEGELLTDVTACSFLGREKDPSGEVDLISIGDPSDTDRSGYDFPCEEWEGVPGLNPEVSPAVQQVVDLFCKTASEVGLAAPSPEEVNELSGLLHSRIAEDGWLDAFEAARHYIRGLGREWWEKNQPKYGLRQLLKEGKVQEYAEKWRVKQKNKSTVRVKPDATHTIPESLDEILGPYKKCFDDLIEVFGPKIKPLPDARRVRALFDSGECTPQKMVNAAKILFASRSDPKYMPLFEGWLKDGGYHVDSAIPTVHHQPGGSRGPAHRAEVDVRGMAQIEKQLSRKKVAEDNGAAHE